MHYNTVGLVMNLKTGIISPQYHIVYDDNFQTVHCSEDIQPLMWEDFVTFNTFCSDFDPDDYVPELSTEWLTEK